MQTRIERRLARYSFDSLYELGTYIDSTPRTWKSNESVEHGSNTDWDLNTRFPQSVKYAREGWIEGAEKTQEALKAFPTKTPQPDTRTDVYGFRPHVPRFCAGAPDSMIRHTRADASAGHGRVLTLFVPVNALASVSAVSMSNFGVAVAQYVNQLESDGMRVELFGMMVSEIEETRLAHAWRIKYADQPLDLAVTAFSLGHPAMFRRLGFALRERSAVNPPWVGAYGSTVAARLSDLINPPPGAVILNGMKDANTHAPTPAKALEYVSKQIEAAIQTQEL